MRTRRYEIKFVVEESLKNHLYNYFATQTAINNTFSTRFVNSIYFDDTLLSCALDNLAGLSYRMKNRFRWYSDNNKLNNIVGPTAFEIKMKNNKLSTKSIISLDSGKYNFDEVCYLSITKQLNNCSNVFKKITFSSMPTLHVQYKREYHETLTGIRITFDSELRFFDAIMNNMPINIEAREFNFHVVELKFFPENLPAVAKLIKGAGVTPVRHSKYLRGLSLFNYIKYL